MEQKIDSGERNELKQFISIFKWLLMLIMLSTASHF